MNAPVQYPSEIRTVIRGVEWLTYVALCEQKMGPTPRMCYSEGVLEMMNPMRKHESIGCIVGRMAEAYSEMKGLEIISLASVTVKQSKRMKGFEADESYYITHAEEMLAKEKLDFESDPPPDLVIEVEITKSAIPKLKLFAALGVPEVWRHNGKKLSMYRLAEDEYQEIESSIELNGLQASLITELLRQRLKIGENQLLRTFRQQVGS